MTMTTAVGIDSLRSPQLHREAADGCEQGPPRGRSYAGEQREDGRKARECCLPERALSRGRPHGEDCLHARDGWPPERAPSRGRLYVDEDGDHHPYFEEVHPEGRDPRTSQPEYCQK